MNVPIIAVILVPKGFGDVFAVAAGLMGFVATKLIARVTAKLKLGGAPFTQQENTVCRVRTVLMQFRGNQLRSPPPFLGF